MIRIVCSSCQKPLSLDETKLPMKEVSFPCPVCKTKLLVDRRNLGSGETAPAPAAEAPPQEPAHGNPEDADGFGAKAPIVGNDSPAIRQALKLIGFMPMHFPTAQLARDFYMQEYPHVVVIHPGQVTAPPLQEMQPIISLTPADRRKSFLILVAESLRTFDGNAAFLYGVNLVVGTKDLGQFPQIYRDALAYHDRLYGPYNSVMKVVNG
jgi:uncharacterized protein YbaR (Trm112 family)